MKKKNLIFFSRVIVKIQQKCTIFCIQNDNSNNEIGKSEIWFLVSFRTFCIFCVNLNVFERKKNWKKNVHLACYAFSQEFLEIWKKNWWLADKDNLLRWQINKRHFLLWVSAVIITENSENETIYLIFFLTYGEYKWPTTCLFMEIFYLIYIFFSMHILVNFSFLLNVLPLKS